jgi:hypothetical protein
MRLNSVAFHATNAEMTGKVPPEKANGLLLAAGAPDAREGAPDARGPSVLAVLTPKRLELWRLVRDRKPASIAEASRLSGRAFKSVLRDLELLEAFGLVKLEAAVGARGKFKVPVSRVERLQVEVT